MSDAKATIITIAGEMVAGRLTTSHAASYGQPVFLGDDGQVYDAGNIVHVGYDPTVIPAPDEVQMTKRAQLDTQLHPLTPAERWPHIAALERAGLIFDIPVPALANIVRLMQAAYRNGQASAGAERVDSEAVWVNGVGLIARQPDGSWVLEGPDTGAAAAAMGRVGGRATSPAKRAAVTENARRAGAVTAAKRTVKGATGQPVTRRAAGRYTVGDKPYTTDELLAEAERIRTEGSNA